MRLAPQQVDDPYERELDENRRLQAELDQENQYIEIQQENERLRAELEETRSLRYQSEQAAVEADEYLPDDDDGYRGNVRGSL
jgi:hypothetical protein